MSGILDDWEDDLTDEEHWKNGDPCRQKTELEKHNEKADANPNQGGQNWD